MFSLLPLASLVSILVDPSNQSKIILIERANSITYRFVMNVDSPVHMYLDDDLLIGKLDSRGDFKLTEKYHAPGFLSGVTIGRLLNDYPLIGTKLYEFRSNRLIPGTFSKDRVFVPEVGESIIHFKDYVYSPDTRPIWNLPGRFELVKKPK